MNVATIDNVEFEFLQDAPYLVYWDGEPYKCKAFDYDGYIYIGNMGIMGPYEDNTPFVMYVDNYGCLRINSQDSGQHTVSIQYIDVEEKRLSCELLPSLYMDGDEEQQVPMMEAIRHTCYPMIIHMTLEADKWSAANDDSGEIWYSVDLEGLDSSYLNDCMFFVTLASDGLSNIKDFYDLKLVSMLFNGYIEGCGQVPTVDIPVDIVFLCSNECFLPEIIPQIDPGPSPC